MYKRTKSIEKKMHDQEKALSEEVRKFADVIKKKRKLRSVKKRK
jgi:hypothetical protein